MKKVSIALDFSKYPIGRDGEFSGRNFRLKILEPLVKQGEVLEVDFDGVYGYPGSSFLDEAFAGLVRKGLLTAKQFRERIKIVNLERSILDEVQSYVKDAVTEPGYT